MGKIPRAVGILIILTAAAVSSLHAEQSLTLSLETPTLEQRADYSSQDGAARDISRSDSSSDRSVSAENGKKVTIGRVAVVQTSKSRIYARRTSKGRVYAVCDAGVPLAIVGEVTDWYGVLMIDGSTGWIKKASVRLLDYQLVSSKPVTRGEYASRGVSDDLRRLASGSQIIQSAFQYMGVPYVWGGNTTSGIDCSGFVRKVFDENGIHLPRTAREQANVGTRVTYDELQPGDRLYFCYKNSYIDHCGIYIGDNMFIHSSASHHGVAVDKLVGRHAGALVCAMR